MERSRYLGIMHLSGIEVIESKADKEDGGR
jgi:hypothetical protein